MDRSFAKRSMKGRSPSKRGVSPKRGGGGAKYHKLEEEKGMSSTAIQDTQMDFDTQNQDEVWSSFQTKTAVDSSKMRKHEIYQNTNYIPDDKSRVLEVNMNSSLFFQMMLYYHFYYDMLYFGLIFPANIYKMMVFRANPFIILGVVLMILWAPIEMFRLNFGYKGNINEAFPEFIAFIIFTFFFTITFSAVIY